MLGANVLIKWDFPGVQVILLIDVKQNLPMPLAIDGEIDVWASSESSVYVICSDLTDISPSWSQALIVS